MLIKLSNHNIKQININNKIIFKNHHEKYLLNWLYFF